MLHTYRFSPSSPDKPVAPMHRQRFVSRRARRFAFRLFSNFPEAILLVLGFGTMAVALIMSKFATWPTQFTN
jgi:hypothetical protein